MINVRAETVAEKPTYKHSFEKKRCLIPASGFYEWKKLKDGKIPYYIHLKGRKLFAFAGFYSEWKNNRKVLKTCSIITTSSNPTLKKIHDRMPVILEKKNEKKWIRETDKDKLKTLLKTFPAKTIEVYKVSTFVNSPKKNSKECINKVKDLSDF